MYSYDFGDPFTFPLPQEVDICGFKGNVWTITTTAEWTAGDPSTFHQATSSGLFCLRPNTNKTNDLVILNHFGHCQSPSAVVCL